jgi:large subunit ribosomal protein L25
MDLTVASREILGKKVKALRKEGLIPAEIYGHGQNNVHITVTRKEFAKAYKEAGSTTVVTLLLDKKKVPVIIHDVTIHPVLDDVTHVDFYQVKMDEKITTMIPLEFVGESPAIKEKGAIINKAMSEIEVEALPGDLPHSIKIDLSVLKDIDESIYVKDIPHPKGVEFLVEEDTAVASATEPAPEEEVAAPAETVDVSAVKVETEEKRAERQAEKTKEEAK